jgi:hypothetical protein
MLWRGEGGGGEEATVISQTLSGTWERGGGGIMLLARNEADHPKYFLQQNINVLCNIQRMDCTKCTVL